jgi:hypothetical protein
MQTRLTGGPRVADDPVVARAAASVVANSLDAVVDLSTARAAAHDASSVRLQSKRRHPPRAGCK